jgi:hypothetical protein
LTQIEYSKIIRGPFWEDDFVVKDKKPSLQFYPGDWRKDPGVQALGYFERGVWFELLLLMFESEPRGMLTLNGNPMPEKGLAQILGLPLQKLRETIDTIVVFGVADRDPDTGALSCRRMLRDDRIRQARAEAGQLGGGSRKASKSKQTEQQNGSKSEAKVKQNRKQRVPPSSSSSSSSSPSGEESDDSLRSSSSNSDHAVVQFASRFEEERGIPYAFGAGDYVQLLNLRNRLGLEKGECPEGWETACINYLASAFGRYTMADMCSRYDVFLKTPLDRFNRPPERKCLRGGHPAICEEDGCLYE